MKFINNNKIVAKTSYISILLILLSISNSHAYFLTTDSIEQIEQKYETIDDHNNNQQQETMQALSNDQSTQQIDQDNLQQQQQQQINNLQHQQQQQQLMMNNLHQQQQHSTLTMNEQNRLNEIYNRLANQAQLIPKNYNDGGNSVNGNDEQQASASNYDEQQQQQQQTAASSQAGYGMYQQNSEGVSKITQIPQGSMFAFPDKNGKLEFESMYAKQPYSIVFRTQSMPVKIKQQHQTLPAPEVEFVRSQEEAHRIKHEVIRPVIQEVHEIIQPYRRVVQEVRPVIENVHTIVAKGEPRQGGGGGGGGNGGGGGMGKTRGGGGGYPDNMSGSYSEQRVRFMAIPSDEMPPQSPQPQPQQRLRHQRSSPYPTDYHHNNHQHYSKNYRGQQSYISELRPQRYIQRRYWDRY
uniref:Transcription factor SPT20 homolog n=1 Tax=Dermatophagoides pteronyssinus TaxID=6956 RepID=A0A6P6YIS7_DERPT|nr:transcription factor SPT20 homolog [Dermatophagoides pteronyssinus]